MTEVGEEEDEEDQRADSDSDVCHSQRSACRYRNKSVLQPAKTSRHSTAFDRTSKIGSSLLTARVFNQDFKDLSEKGIRDQVDSMKAIREVKL